MLFQKPAGTIMPGYLIPTCSLDAPKASPGPWERIFKYFTFILLSVISGLFPQMLLAPEVSPGRK
ncbi:MAG: hypothetical protein QOI94_2289 [Acidobacteriaceae bacterium]|jgi:hypothetical protein|nr:hypothetical protein [Acidobacteriaceae bacterium]